MAELIHSFPVCSVVIGVIGLVAAMAYILVGWKTDRR
jgi:hypothetical protein